MRGIMFIDHPLSGGTRVSSWSLDSPFFFALVLLFRVPLLNVVVAARRRVTARAVNPASFARRARTGLRQPRSMSSIMLRFSWLGGRRLLPLLSLR